jgi:hypothetical protein
MLLAVVDHVAALAERLEIAAAVVGWIVIEMGRCERHSHLTQPCSSSGPVLVACRAWCWLISEGFLAAADFVQQLQNG